MLKVFHTERWREKIQSIACRVTTVRAVLIDLDGVIYQEGALVPGALEAIDWLIGQEIPYLFLTNTTSSPRQSLVQLLARMGVRTDEERILTPAVAAAAWLRHNAVFPTALFVPAALEVDLGELPTLARDAESGAGSVVIGDLGRDWGFTEMNRAFRLLMANPEAPLVALGKARYWRAQDGLRLDSGPIAAALEFAADRKAVVFGKPSAEFFQQAVAKLGCVAADAVMVGDDIAADVLGAQQAGLRGVLVRTGKFRSADLERQIRPDGILESIMELPAWLLQFPGRPEPG